MWLLTDNNEKTIYLRPGQIFSVGRKHGSLVLANDASISRHHAEITIDPKEDINQINDNTDPLSICTIKDSGSKYGTFIQSDDVDISITKQGQALKHMDKVRFGVQQSIFTVMYIPIITATTGLTKDEINELHAIVDSLDGRIIHVWDAMCTHMTVSNPTISEKLTCSLTIGIPIVPFDYWKSLSTAFEKNEKLPDPLEFAGLVENKLRLLGNISVKPDPRRRTILKNLTFIHYGSNQYDVYSRMIKLAGGKSLLYRNVRETNLDVCADNVLVVQLVESNTTQATATDDVHYAAACLQLGKCRRRTIPSSEIPLAIFHVSTEKYCNPKHDRAEMFKKKINNYGLTSTVLALDTQDVDLPMAKRCKQMMTSRIDNKSLPDNDYIAETIEESIETNSQSSQIVSKKSSICLPKSTENNSDLNQSSNPARSSADAMIPESESQFENDSFKVASMNYERYMNEEFDKMKVGKMSIERICEEDDNVDVTKQKVCNIVTTDDHPEKEVTSMKSHMSYDEMMPDDDDMSFFDEKINDLLDEKLPIGRKNVDNEDEAPIDNVRKRRSKPDVDDRSFFGEKIVDLFKEKLPIAKKVVDNEDEAPIDNVRERRSRSPLASIGITESYRAGTSRQIVISIDDENPRKRKSNEISPSSYIVQSPSKRNKITSRSPKKFCKLLDKPESGQTTLNSFLSPKKDVNDHTERAPVQKPEKKQRHSASSLRLDLSSSINMKSSGSKNHDPNTTEFYINPCKLEPSRQLLLRIESTTDLDSLAVPKFGKSFRKTNTIHSNRIDLDDMIDMRLWIEEKNNSR